MSGGEESGSAFSLYLRSSTQHWHTFFMRAHAWQTTVFLYLASAPGFQRNTVYGRSHVLHA